MTEKRNDQNGDSASNGTGEVRLRGVAVSRGVAAAPIQIVHGTDRQFFRRSIDPSEVEAELRRFRLSLASSHHQLSHLLEGGSRSGPLKDILATQQMMLDDPALAGEIEASIRGQLVNAEWAAMSVIAAISAQLRGLNDQNLRERHADVEDIGERILAALAGDGQLDDGLATDSVIVASELRPSTLAALSIRRVKAIATEHGGWTSHTFILAREMGIPAVTGIHDLLRNARSGAMILVDGNSGEVIIDPATANLPAIAQKRAVQPHADETRNDPGWVTTVDGRAIAIKANIDFPAFYPKAVEAGARGIGLYRSEFLLDRFRALPSEDEQFAAYREVAGFGVCPRTFRTVSETPPSGSAPFG